MLNVFKVSDDRFVVNNSDVKLIAYPGNAYYVDGDNGVDTASGRSWKKAVKTIAQAITLASANDTIAIKARKVAAGGTDPVNYAETLTIPATKPGLRLIGVANGTAQGAQPQIKIGAGSTAMLTVQAPGCLIKGLSFNGGSSTGGGILLDDDGSTKAAFGTVIEECFFKNCVGSGATDAKTGGAIMWSSQGGAWQVRIRANRFYNNIGGIVLLGTGGSRPKDVVIEGNTFGADAAASVDCYIYGAAGSGFVDLTIANNVFGSVLPNAGTVNRYMDLTNCASGIVSGNMFGGASGTYGAAGNAAKIPTTIGIAFNYQDGALIART